MDKHEEGFHKRLTFYSLLGTVFFAVVMVLITLGFSWSQFNSVPSVDNSQLNNSTVKAIQTFTSSVQESGNKLVQYSTYLLLVGIPFFSIMIFKETSKSKSKNGNPTQTNPLDEIVHRKDLEVETPDDNTRILDEDMNYQSIDSEKKQLQESLQNVRSQLQIAEIKLQIIELKNQKVNEKLNKLESKGKKSRSKPRSKKHDSKGTKKSL
ncbi:MAG: hypothetical protein ACYDAJ_07275 [Nitrosotalea sp.]